MFKLAPRYRVCLNVLLEFTFFVRFLRISGELRMQTRATSACGSMGVKFQTFLIVRLSVWLVGLEFLSTAFFVGTKAKV